MAREHKRQRKDINYAEDLSDTDFNLVADDSDDDFVPTGQVKVKKEPKEKSLPKPPSKATVTLLAMGDPDSETQSLENVDKAILERIKKALSLSRHPGTTEHEAHQALRLGWGQTGDEVDGKSEAQVLRSMDEKEERLKHVVTVSCEEHANMYIHAWAATVSSAVSNIFDIKEYTEQVEDNEVQYVFYGLAPNSVSAAHAFEMVYNLILQWRMANKEAKGLNAKNAYCRGVADGLCQFSRKERKRTEKEARQAEARRLEAQQKEEEEQRQKEIKRLEAGVGIEVGLDTEEEEEQRQKEVERLEPTVGNQAKFATKSGEQRQKEVERLDPKGIEAKLDRKARIIEDEDEDEETNHDTEPAKHFFSTSLLDRDESEDSQYDYDDSDYGDYAEEENDDLQAGLDTEEARAEDAVAPDIRRVREEVGDIDLEELQKKSDERMRQPAENPEAVSDNGRKEVGGQHRVKKEEVDEIMQDVQPTRDEVVVKLEELQEIKFEQHEIKLEQQEVKLEQQEIKLEQQPDVKLEQQEVKIEEEPVWDSVGALIAFRETSLLLADDYLKNAGIKLHSRRKNSKLQLKDANAAQSYHKGWEDSKKIDLKRKRIKTEDDDD
ncbi:hypothetical protein EV360DRAFT_84973 [Lentinula raphanica]|nr:hypothetical protein EV360DRAFT_84973 [Lentinula raphanica]